LFTAARKPAGLPAEELHSKSKSKIALLFTAARKPAGLPAEELHSKSKSKII
jgi:hypothetical protein